MIRNKVGASALFALATAAVVALLLLSDFGPAPLTGLRDLGADEDAELTAIAVRCRPCANGYLLNLSDGDGGQADAFCPLGLLTVPIPNGTLVKVTLRRSADDPTFLIVQKIQAEMAADGKDS